MANLQETPTWEAGIYQLETSDPVMGGENGIDNRAPRQLANRTLWLKNELARQIGVVNSGKLGKTENAVSATKLATARNIAMTGDGSWNVNFDGSQNATGALTLANSGVTAGSYNSVTVDAKGRVTAGLTQTHGLVTATTAQGTANVATGNGNTFLNIVASGVGQTASVGSSTQITGTNGITVSSDTVGKLIVSRDSNSPTATKLQTARTINGVTFDGTTDITVGLPTFSGYISQSATTLADANTAPSQGGFNVRHLSSNTTNKPSGISHSMMTCAYDGRFATQIATDWRTNKLYSRTLNDGRWMEWKELAYIDGNISTATKLATARTLAITGDGTGQANFDGSANANIAITLANSGVTAGSYNSVTVDAKGRVTAGLTQTHGLVTATTATGTTNTATTNTNTFLNIVASGVGQTASVGSSTQITGTNGISVSSDTAGKLIVTRDSNSPTATKLQTARTLSITGDGTGQANFDGSANANIALILANSGVAAGSYNSVTVDAKGRVTAGLTQTHGLVTATTAQGTANVATGNGNTFLNIVASGVGQTASVGSSTQITGTNGIGISSDTAGKLIVTRDSNSPTATKLQTARNIALTGAVTGNVNFDGSGNVSLATTLKPINRRDYTGILTPSHNGFRTQTVNISGSVEVSPNGRIIQYFTFVCPVVYFHRHGLSAFYREKLGVSTFAAEDSPLLELPLWTPMPNKVQEARIHLSANLNHSANGEALEWIYDWDATFNHHANIKDKAYFAFRRWGGSQDELVAFTIIVEGY